MEAVMKTHVGHIRQVNEDSGDILHKDDQKVLFTIVADGMGGHQAGDVASQMALQILTTSFEQVDASKNEVEWKEWLHEAITEANQSIYQYALQHPAYFGMGTTLVCALFLRDFYILAHVGDSRIYCLIDQTLTKLTDDHSLVNELLLSGEISTEEAEDHPQRNVITRALGTEETVDIDLSLFPFTDEEYFLLCSDGLSDVIPPTQIKEVLLQRETLDEKASALLQSALDAGGDDNISLIIVQADDKHQ